MEQNIYFDNGSTSWPKAPGVAVSMTKLLESGAFNINRGNYEGAYELENQVLKTRMQLARFFHAPDSRCVVFTPGITYSLNCLLKGFLKPGDHVLVSSLEHNASALSACFTGYPLYDDSCRDRRHNASGIARSSDPSGDKSSHHAPRFQCMRNHSANP